MMRRTTCLALGYVCGILLATAQPGPLPAALLPGLSALGLAGLVVTALRERRWVQVSLPLIVATAVLGGLPLGYWRAMSKLGPPPSTSLRHALAQLPADTPLDLEGVICHEPEQRSSRSGDLVLAVDAIRPPGDSGWRPVSPGRVLVRVQHSLRRGAPAPSSFNALMDSAAYGYRVRVHADYGPAEAALNPGAFDFPAFLRQQNMVASLRCHIGRVEVLERSRGNLLTELALAAKKRFLVTYKQTIRSPGSRLVAAATLGTRRAVERVEFRGREVRETFRHAGVGHVLAVSGLHVSVVSILLYALLHAAGLRPRVIAPILITFLVLFALLTGARPSSVRAVIMNAVILVAFAYLHYDLRRATCVGLGVSALGILLYSPMVLYAPSFLLSFGAVLSLVTIAPTMDRWLRGLRGAALGLAAAWLVALMATCALNVPALLSPWVLSGYAGALVLAVLLGNRFNDRFPRAWQIGLERMPAGLRMFFSAQLAIQLGMMIPLSAWFFGRFPLAGVAVNLPAIPAIGVLVQLGLLTGLVGLVPFIGVWLARPFGAAATVVAEGFFELANAGAVLFPFPAVPRPSPAWILGYYVVLALVISTRHWARPIQVGCYRAWPWLSQRKRLLRVSLVIPAILLALPLRHLLPESRRCDRVLCLATGSTPVVAACSDRHDALLLNAGDEWTAGRALFDVLRSAGAVVVQDAIIAGPAPRIGNAGVAALGTKMPVHRTWLPILPETPETYLQAIGDAWLVEQAAAGKRWVEDYVEAYADLLTAAHERGIELRPLPAGPVVTWDNLAARALPPPATRPERFVSRARTALIELEVNGFRWLILTDSTPAAVEEAVAVGAAPYDVLVVSDRSSRTTYRRLLATVTARARPRVVILCGSKEPQGPDINAWARDRGVDIFLTARTGAITATFPAKGQMELTAHIGGRTLLLGQ